MKLLQYVGDAFYRVINLIGQEKDCPSCKAYREFLEIESQRARYFEQLLLTRAGIIDKEHQQVENEEYQPVFHRASTLSSIRRAAEELTKKRPVTIIASDSELTEAERLFQQEKDKLDGKIQ